MNYYPVNLNITGRLCVVIGGGPVAWRKVDSLLYCGAEVTVISPEVCQAIRLAAEAGRIDWLQRKYAQADLDDTFLVFAATDDHEIQKQIVLSAKQKGVLINCVDIPEQCDFQVPAKIRRGKLMIAVSTGGGSPALSAQIKQRLLEEYGPEYAVIVDLMTSIRRHVVGNRLPQRNNKLFYDVLALPLPELIRTKNWQKIEELLGKVLPSTICSKSLVGETRNRIHSDSSRYAPETR